MGTREELTKIPTSYQLLLSIASKGSRTDQSKTLEREEGEATEEKSGA